MGVLRDHDLASLMQRFGARVLVETGAGTGTGIRHAQGLPFDQIISCEIDCAQAAHLNATISAQDPRVWIMCATSEAFLKELLPTITSNVIFFLDAHFPGADLGKAAYDAEPNLDLRLPLERELDVIHTRAGRFKDVIIIDDLRIFEDVPGIGGLKEAGLGHLMKPGTAFLDRWEATHTVEKQARNTGYVVCLPR